MRVNSVIKLKRFMKLPRDDQYDILVGLIKHDVCAGSCTVCPVFYTCCQRFMPQINFGTYDEIKHAAGKVFCSIFGSDELFELLIK